MAMLRTGQTLYRYTESLEILEGVVTATELWDEEEEPFYWYDVGYKMGFFNHTDALCIWQSSTKKGLEHQLYPWHLTEKDAKVGLLEYIQRKGKELRQELKDLNKRQKELKEQVHGN